MDWPLHNQAKKQIENYLAKPAHGLMITGQPGSGKKAVALEAAARLLNTSSADQHPYFMLVSRPEGKQEISIDDIRAIGKFLQLKVPGKSQINRVVLIDNGQHMSTEAQNAFLKILEEPAPGTVLILTVDSPQSVLPTVVSRTQKIAIPPISLDDAINYYSGQYSENQIRSAWQLGQGAAALIHAILSEDNDHPLKKAVDEAKDFLAREAYERLIILDKLSKDKEHLKLLLDALARITGALQRSAVEKGATGQTRKLLAARRLIDKSLQELEINAAPRLVCQNLVLNLPV